MGNCRINFRLVSFTLLSLSALSQTNVQNPLVGNWRLQQLIDGRDTLFDAGDKRVFQNWFLAKMGSFKDPDETDTSAYASMRELEQSLDKARASFSSDGQVSFEVGLDKYKKGTYRIEGTNSLLIKWSSENTEKKLKYWVKEGIFCYYEKEKPSQVYYFKINK